MDLSWITRLLQVWLVPRLPNDLSLIKSHDSRIEHVRPDNQRKETPPIRRDTFDGCDQRLVDCVASGIHNIFFTDKNFEKAQSTHQDAHLIHIVDIFPEQMVGL